MQFKLRALALALGLCALAFGARAQAYIRVTNCGDPAPPAGASSGYMDAKGNICTSASGGTGSAVTVSAPLGAQLKAASVSTTGATVTWIAPTSASITSSGTVVAAGPAVSVITNATASGGGILTLNLFGGTAVANVGVPLQPGASATISGQPAGTAITGICSTGTCTVAVQSGT